VFTLEMLMILGVLAAGMTSLSYIPRFGRRCRRDQPMTFSSRPLSSWAAGLGLRILYGAFKGDWVIIIANSIGFALVAVLLALKMRDAQWLAKATAKAP
jgi:MtN3 and saliva related transmembrane protein